MPRGTPTPLTRGERVVVAHGTLKLSGKFVCFVTHPLYGECVDVLVDGDELPRRFQASRVSRFSPNAKGRPLGREVGPESGTSKKEAM